MLSSEYGLVPSAWNQITYLLTYDPELLLKGLALLYQLNAPQQHHHPAGGRKPHGQNFRRHRPFRRERHETEAKAG